MEDWRVTDLEQDRVIPYVFAHCGLGARRVPTAVWAKPGWFSYDTMTLVGPGSWEAARAAVDAALTAVDLVLGGEPVAYACTRPPGHDVTRSAYGGSCYLNNAALAAAALRARVGGPVAVLDIDAHHGNGTQEIFRDRSDVLIGSVHVDPGAGWFPHFLRFADESGDANVNLPLAPGSGDGLWLEVASELVSRARGAAGVVVALGVDAAAADPAPTVLVQEGGYDLDSLSLLVREALLGLEEGRG